MSEYTQDWEIVHRILVWLSIREEINPYAKDTRENKSNFDQKKGAWFFALYLNHQRNQSMFLNRIKKETNKQIKNEKSEKKVKSNKCNIPVQWTNEKQFKQIEK